MIQTIVALVVFSSAYALIRIALTELPPLSLAALRFVLASAVMVPVALAYHGSTGSRAPIQTHDIPMFATLAIVQIFMPNLLQNIGLEYTTASVSSVLQSITPVFTLVLSFMLLREIASLRQIIGMIFGILGVLLHSTGGNLTNLSGSTFFGNILQVGVAASYAVSGITGKFLMKRHSPMFVVTTSFVLGGALLSVCAIAFERSMWPSSLSFEVIVALLLLSFMYCLGLVSWYDVLQRTSVFRLYALLFVMPVLAVVISVAVLRENFTASDVVFSAVTLFGVALVQVDRK